MSFVDADEAIGQLKHVVAQADDDELCVLRPLLDVVSHNRHVFEIKGCINLVHEVQRCRFEMMESENECQRAQRLREPTMVGQASPKFGTRSDAHLLSARQV